MVLLLPWRHSSLLLLGRENAAVAAARREEVGRCCRWLSWRRENAAELVEEVTATTVVGCGGEP